MAIINPVILPAKALKGGAHKVRIAIAHNGTTRYLPTDVIIDSDKEFRNGAVVRRPDAAYLNTRLRGFLQRYQDIIDQIDYIDGLTCPELIFLIKHGNQSKNRTLGSIMEEMLEYSSVKNSTRERKSHWWRVVKRIIPEDTKINNISQATLRKLETAIRARKCGPATIRNYMSFFISILNYAKKNGYVQYKIDPAMNYKCPGPQVRDAWLSVDEVRAVRDCVLRKGTISKARDIFMLSYYLGGINIVDLVKINFNDNRDTLRYIRTKTETKNKVNKYVEFDIPAEAKDIIERYKSKEGFLFDSNKCKI